MAKLQHCESSVCGTDNLVSSAPRFWANLHLLPKKFQQLAAANDTHHKQQHKNDARLKENIGPKTDAKRAAYLMAYCFIASS